MASFDDLESLCQHLEQHAQDYKHPHQIGKEFQSLRDAAKRNGDAQTERRAQWEIDCFHVVLTGGNAEESFLRSGAKGETLRWPDIGSLGGDAYAYLDRRAMATTNVILRARYAHILWCSPAKHQKYAQMAIVAYLDLVHLYETSDMADPDAHFGLNVLDSVENAYRISRQVKWKIQDVKSEIERLVLSFNPASSSSFALRANLLRLMLATPRGFKVDDFRGLAETCWCTSSHLVIARNLHGAISMLDLGEKVDVRMRTHSYPWSRQRAELYVQLMNQRKPGDLAAPEFCRHAIENYRQAGDDAKALQLEVTYRHLKQAMTFQALGGEIDVSDMVRRSVEKAEEITAGTPEDIIQWLMFSRGLLANYENVEEGAEAAMGKYVFLQFAPITVLDRRGNAAQHFVEPDERKYHAMLQDYRIYVEIVTRLYLHQVLMLAIRTGKLNAETLTSFLRKNSWIGRDLSLNLPNNEVAVYNWLALLSPGLHEYFRQVGNWITSAECRPSLVLVIDSLALKIEGLLRDICRLSGGVTSYSAGDAKDRIVEREKDIHMLLYDPQVVGLIGFDDLLFLRFLLVEKAGYNLRHRVAHALMHPGQYVLDYAHLLILAVLRLAKYDFRSTEAPESALQASS